MYTVRALIWAALLLGATSAPNAGQAPSATIDAGIVIGTAVTTSGASATVVNKFLGIPFAASPTRFAPPAPPTPWSQPYDATRYGFTCPQQFNYPEPARSQTMQFQNQFLQAAEGEDCLNLNIWTPGNAGSGKAVMVWIFGGGLTTGSNALSLYDGSGFAANQDVVMVSINYRTNLYGFPESPLLPFKENNLGFLDQRMALDWVQRNIHAFGGDPARVTIFGESAGASSVDYLLLTHPVDPPFSAAISQSGTAALYSGLQSSDYPEPWNAMVEAVNCSGSSDILACVRAVPQVNLTHAIEISELNFRPVIDNITVPAHPEALRLSGKIAQVPLLTGTNANEGRIFAISYVGADSALPFLNSTYGLNAQQAEALLSLYPINSTFISNAYTQIAQIQTDVTFTCPAALQFNHTRSLGIPTWRYYYNASFPNTNYLPVNLGAFHASEIPSVFGTFPFEGATEPQKRLSEYMQTSWGTFARNPQGGPGWSLGPDVQALGADEMGVGVAHTVSAETIDRTCFAFEPYYSGLG